jgi:hypothetical protein
LEVYSDNGRVEIPIQSNSLNTVLSFQSITVRWKISDGGHDYHTFLVPSDTAQFYEVLRKLGNNAFGEFGSRSEKELWKRLKDEVGPVTAPWALNVHKAQG